MPFDGLPKNEALVEARVALTALARELRENRKHLWSFASEGAHTPGCGTTGCAIGLARIVPECVAIWPVTQRFGQPSLFGNDLPLALLERGIPGHALASFFYAGYFGEISTCGGEIGEHYPACDFALGVTPTMVADRIDHWLATGEIR